MPDNAQSPEYRDSSCSSPGCACHIDRRRFIQWAGAGAVSLPALADGLAAVAGPFGPRDTIDHFVPIDKKLAPKWLETLRAKGERTWYTGNDLRTIAMPVGGICAGQVYLTGDGRLVHWDVFNLPHGTDYGGGAYNLGRSPGSPLAQGFAVRVQSGGRTITRALDAKGFPKVTFCGEYPIGTVVYEDKDVPVSVTLDAFSPFIPLNAADSALPVTVMQFTVKNTSQAEADVTLAGWLENAVFLKSGQELSGVRVNQLVKGNKLTMLQGTVEISKTPPSDRAPIVIADFEAPDYGEWTVEGEAFGKGPAHGTIGKQQKVSGFLGKGLVNTYLGSSDKPTGKLTSPPLKIQRRFISFLVGGGAHADKTCINLLVDGKRVRTATGKNMEKLSWHNWNVADLMDKEARIEIVDQATGEWGHINVDQIEQRDKPRSSIEGPPESQPDFGSMGLAVLGEGDDVLASLSLPEPDKAGIAATLFSDSGLASAGEGRKPLDQSLCGALGKKFRVAAGQQAKVTFLVAWSFPNRPKNGNFYAVRCPDAAATARYVAENFQRLSDATRLWHDTWYDSSLPYWLLDRLFSTTSTLATSTCQWWKNSRFWAWEGVHCCHGTCGHVWNYAHAMARLFPELERSVRVMQDYNPEAGFDAKTGMIRFRGEGWGQWAGDSQPGYVLKAYREHQMAPDAAMLKKLWPRIRQSLEFLMREDKDGDGLIEGTQHNTYDINFYGPNTMVGSLYLAALRAGEELALDMGDKEFAATCRKIFEAGEKNTVEKLFNGEYFVQKVDLKKHPNHQYADGCLADQLFGQGWAHHVGLGYVYPEDKVRSALEAIWKYDWAPDIGPQNKAHPPQRWFARPGEAGLFTCTWPKSKHLGPNSVLYRDEIWTGIEYQVAGHMVWEGMVTEALAICRGVHERYHPAKHNPWNEVECGDHYARGMASYGVFTALCGLDYHGPKGHLGFAPRLTPEDFRAAFTAAEGWGTLCQKRDAAKNTQTARIELKHGKLTLRTLAFELPEKAKLQRAAVTAAGQVVAAQAKQDGRRVLLTLAQPATVKETQAIEVQIEFTPAL